MIQVMANVKSYENVEKIVIVYGPNLDVSSY